MAYAQSGYGSGNFYVYNHYGRVLTNCDAFTAAYKVNKHNNGL